MKRHPIVFAGPSLSGVPASDLTRFDMAAPASCGDIVRAVQGGYRTIALIDGYFEAAPAVWHKEILYAIASGCAVLGGSSMGALRAAECHGLGMIGIGQVFAEYRDGLREADADVAVTHGPAELGYPLLGVALVDAEDGLDRLLRAGWLTGEQHARAEASARATHFKQRDWDGILTSAGLGPEDHRQAKFWLVSDGPGVKTRDALALLDYLGDAPAASSGKTFVRTRFFDQLLQRLEEEDHARISRV